MTYYFVALSEDWFGKEFADSMMSADKTREVRLLQCVGRVWTRSMSVVTLLEGVLAAIATPVNTGIGIGLPDSWLFRRLDPYMYYDPATPQYNLQISVRLQSPSDEETPLEFVRRILPMVSPDAEPVALSPERGIAYYRTTTPENGQPKDDRHWILAERRERHIRYALFTLSVLAARADGDATDSLAALLDERIRKARFLG